MQIKRIALGGIIMTVIMFSGCSTTVQNLAIGEEKTLETGKTEPSLKTIVKLAELYKVSTDMILGRKQKVINKPLERRVLKIYEIENTVKKRT